MNANQPRQPKGRPTGGEFAGIDRPEGDVSLNPFATQTPVEVDMAIGDAYERIYKVRAETAASRRTIEEIREGREKFEQTGVHDLSRRWIYDDSYLERAKARVAAADAEIDTLISDVIEPRNAEWKRRGRWSRFYLVVSSGGGHVHSSMECSTCYPTTEFTWLPDESGKDDAEIIDRAGDQACTVCFPSAPVAQRGKPRKGEFEHPDKKKAREEREAARRAREEKARAAGVWMPDGSQLKEAPGVRSVNGDGTVVYYPWDEVIKTERTADIKAVDILEHYEGRREADTGPLDDHYNAALLRARERQDMQTLDNILTGLAHKHGTTKDEEYERLNSKAKAKIRKRGW